MMKHDLLFEDNHTERFEYDLWINVELITISWFLMVTYHAYLDEYNLTKYVIPKIVYRFHRLSEQKIFIFLFIKMKYICNVP